MKKIISLALATVLALSLVGCSSGSDYDDIELDPKEIITEFEAKVPQEERPMSMIIDDTILKDTYGLNSDLVESYAGSLPMMVTHAEEHFIAKVQDGKMEEVKAKIIERQKVLEEQWSIYLPEQYEMVQNYQLVEKGDYIAFAIGYNADTIIEIFESKFE